MTASKAQFFKPSKASASSKAETTDQTARAIVAAEVRARQSKTEKLRALRLQSVEEVQEAAPPKKNAKRRKAD